MPRHDLPGHSLLPVVPGFRDDFITAKPSSRERGFGHRDTEDTEIERKRIGNSFSSPSSVLSVSLW